MAEYSLAPRALEVLQCRHHWHALCPGGSISCTRAVPHLYSYGLDLFLLSIDEGISGYRDDSLETVKRNEQSFGIPLVVVRCVINSLYLNKKRLQSLESLGWLAG